MIVIATHEGQLYIETMLNSLRSCNHNENILVVDTQSSENYWKYLNVELKTKFPEIQVDRTPYKGYDSGAYIFAYEKYIDHHYIFLHDSIIIKDYNIMEKILKELNDNSVVALIGFGEGSENLNYDSIEDQQFVQKNCNSLEFCDGIFGPMFAINRIILQKFEKYNHLIIPSKKTEQRAMERLWSVVCKIHNINIIALHRYNPTSFYSGDYVIFYKIHASKQHLNRQ